MALDRGEVAERREVRVRRSGPPWWVAPAAGTLAAGVVPFALCAAAIPVRDDLPSASTALGIAVVVSVLAATTSRLGAVIAAVSGSLGFDLWLTKPYGSLQIAQAADAETAGLLLLVSVIVGQLAARSRFYRRRAAQSRFDLGRVHGVAELISSGADAQQVVEAVESELFGLLGLRSCAFHSGMPIAEGPAINRDGSVSWGSLRWGFLTVGLPIKPVALPVHHRGRRLGHYLLQAVPGARVTKDELVVAITLADLAAASLAGRATLI